MLSYREGCYGCYDSVDKMIIKEAIDRMGRSRHGAIVIKCLKHKDGLTYKDLYAEYCKMCEKEDIMPLALSSLYGIGWLWQEVL